MADSVKVEIDLVAGKLGLECSESSVDSILARLADFLPKFREQAAHPRREPNHHSPVGQVQDAQAQTPKKTANSSADGTGKKRAPTAARASSASDARPEVQNLHLNVDEPKLLAWSSLDKDWKKYLWILESARLQGVNGLTNSEISYLMTKTFREARDPKTVNNLRQKIKSRNVQSFNITSEGKTYSVWKILADGTKQVVKPEGVVEA